MTTTIMLVRHAAHDLLGKVLAGRRLEVALNVHGAGQAERLAAQLAGRGVDEVRSSPRLRALQTARPIARACGVPVAIAAEFDEIDFGDWAGRACAELRDDWCWERWNSARAQSRPPGGESMAELQWRVVNGLIEIAAACPGKGVVVVTHAEPIRAAILHCRGLSPDDFARVAVDPASVTTFQFSGKRDRLMRENETCDAGRVPA